MQNATDAKDTLAAYDDAKRALLFIAPDSLNGYRLTSAEIEAFHGELSDAMANAFHRITSGARMERDNYERGDRLAAHREWSTYTGTDGRA